MSNNAYLTTTEPDTIYPSVVLPDFEQEESGIAVDANAVPLLWLALFRSDDLVTADVYDPPEPDDTEPEWGEDEEEDDEPDDRDDVDIEATAPVTSKAEALDHLAEAVPILEDALDARLSPYADMLRAAVTDTVGAAVTIEWDEVESLWAPDSFLPAVRRVWAALDRGSFDAQDRAALVDLTALRPAPIPDVRILLDGAPTSVDDEWNHTRVLGSALARPVPWEPSDVS
ncbi:hypothetical protein [Microbacterium gorillae]|uniref:hypothetical protein n=1 Tax=Microbacterium gorillae TaxID=1231063 RepID=UPI00058BA4E9|nr:hypothetical protein [Microbacterium gorillae]